MPLRVVEFEGLSYAFIILADPKWGDEDCHVMMISGTFSHFSLAQLIMHFAQNQPFTAELGTDGSIWGWTGPKAKLNTLLGYDLYCSCANCWIKCAACMDQQCSKCRYFRYCSRACSIQGWKPRLLGHKACCPQMSSMYNRFARRTSRFSTVAYGFMSSYEYNLWTHLLTDPVHSRVLVYY